ncbi:hypothetical protein KC930_00760 [Candidatus Saccharibacteria bacterium]|nr:hypothetical protein [Candidatus Saccharibacteria bacterium]
MKSNTAIRIGKYFSTTSRAERILETLRTNHAVLAEAHKLRSGEVEIPVLGKPDILMHPGGFTIPYVGSLLEGTISVSTDPSVPVLIHELRRSTAPEVFDPVSDPFHRSVLKAASRGVKAYRAGLELII